MPYQYIGRYRIPSRLGRADITVGRRFNAVKTCFRLAQAKRAQAFAIRAVRTGTQCYLSRLTSTRFTRGGRTPLGGLKVYVMSRGQKQTTIVTNSNMIKIALLRYFLLQYEITLLRNY